MSRVDERLIHGQIVNEWITKVVPTHLVIMDEDLVLDLFMANIYKALTPLWLDVQILAPGDACYFLRDCAEKDWRIFLLARTPCAFEKLIKAGYFVDEIILADKKYLPNKRNLQTEYKRSINWLLERNVRIIMQEFPADTPFVLTPYQL